jgi:hypothetical protein
VGEACGMQLASVLDAMRRHVNKSRAKLKQARAYAALSCALLLAALIPAPHNRAIQGNIFHRCGERLC